MAKALVLGGSTGLLGQTLVKTLETRGWETQSLGRADGDLRDINFLRDKLYQANADVIFNTLAWTQVDAAEDHQEEARELNRTFPDALAHTIVSLGKGHLVHYSTDFVFSGKSHKAWKETDPPDPQNVYGATKLEGEKAVLSILPDSSCVLRTAWLFGPGKKNFVTTILDACQKRDMISVVDDQTGSPTYTVDLALWSAMLAEKRACGIWHCVNSGQASWCELAAEAVHLALGDCRVEPISSSQWPQKAKRPEFGVLDTSKLTTFLGQKPRCWAQALRDYIFGYIQTGSRKNA